MRQDAALVDRVRTALAATPRVVEKRMFGGTAFLVRGKICVSARPERLMCRIDPAVHDAALERKGCRTMTMKGREYRGYVYVDAGAVSNKRDLDYWIALALDYNASAKTVRKKK